MGIYQDCPFEHYLPDVPERDRERAAVHIAVTRVKDSKLMLFFNRLAHFQVNSDKLTQTIYVNIPLGEIRAVFILVAIGCK